MRTTLALIGLTSVLGLGTLAGCGGDNAKDSSSSSVPTDRVAASTAPPRLAFYGGVECAGTDAFCDDILARSRREGYAAFCRGGVPHPEAPSSFSFGGKEYNYVCFQLERANQLVNFYFADTKIVRSVHVSADRFPQTCDNGYCISGEWFGTRKVHGTIRNPNGVTSTYRASALG